MAIINATGDANDTGGFKAVTPGWYDLYIVGTKVNDKKGKAPSLQVTIEVRKADDQGAQDQIGRTVNTFLQLDKAGRCREMLDAIGVAWSATAGTNGPGISFDNDHMTGRYFRARMEHTPKDGGGKWENWREIQASALSPQPGQAMQAAPTPQAAPMQVPGGVVPQGVPQGAPQVAPQGYAQPGYGQPGHVPQGAPVAGGVPPQAHAAPVPGTIPGQG